MATGNKFYDNLPKEKQEQYAILFEDKSGWYTEDGNGEKDWVKLEKKINEFDSKLKKFITLQKNNYSYNLSLIIFVSFKIKNYFIDSYIDKDINFFLAKFMDYANFKNTIFSKKSDFSRVHFLQDVDFSESTFSDVANFGYSKYSYASFQECNFKMNANFSRSIFNNHIVFTKTTFSKNIDISFSVFKDYSFFNVCDFIGKANFMGVSFKKEVRLYYAIFRGKTTFERANFIKKAIFQNTIFENETSFMYSIFNNETNFYDAVFKKEINFQATKFKGFTILGNISLGILNITGISHKNNIILLALHGYENNQKNPLKPKNFFNKESARLIKDHFEKQNNITEANKYFVIEQEKHIEALNNPKNKTENSKLVKLIPLYLNKYISNFGIDWFRGLLTLSLFGYVVLFFYMALRYLPFNYPNQFYMAGNWQTSNLSATLFSFIVIAILYTINLKYVKIQEKLSNLKRYSVVKRYKKIFWLLRITRNIISNIVRYKIILSIVVIICVLSYLSKNDTTNLITQLLNPINAFKDDETFKGYETFGAIVRIISATIIYQIIVAFRQNTRRK